MSIFCSVCGKCFTGLLCLLHFGGVFSYTEVSEFPAGKSVSLFFMGLSVLLVRKASPIPGLPLFLSRTCLAFFFTLRTFCFTGIILMKKNTLQSRLMPFCTAVTGVSFAFSQGLSVLLVFSSSLWVQFSEIGSTLKCGPHSTCGLLGSRDNSCSSDFKPRILSSCVEVSHLPALVLFLVLSLLPAETFPWVLLGDLSGCLLSREFCLHNSTWKKDHTAKGGHCPWVVRKLSSHIPRVTAGAFQFWCNVV